MLPPIENYSESCRLRHGRLFSTGLPWQLELLQDSMVSTDKEEEVAVPEKARYTYHTLHEPIVYSKHNPVLLTEETRDA